MPVYLDHNATTPLHPLVFEAMQPYLTQVYGNPSSVHRFGRMTRDALEMARNQVAQLVGAQAAEVVFTSGGSEANNLALKGALSQLKPARLTVSDIEHACLLAPAQQLLASGWQLDRVAVNLQGQVTAENLAKAIHADTRFMSVMAANNETGAVQEIRALVSLARKLANEKAVSEKLSGEQAADIICHSDACQMVAKLPLNFAETGLDLMSLSSHKLYGPQGAGALIVKGHIDLQSQISGGGQERNRRSGTENLAAIVGFGAAAQLAQEKQAERAQHSQALQQQLTEQLQAMSGIEVFSCQVPRLPNTVQFSVSGIDGEMLLMQLDKKGFAVSSGSACDSGKTEPSHVLLAMGVDKLVAKGAIRVSFGEQNNADQVTQFVDALISIRQQFN